MAFTVLVSQHMKKHVRDKDGQACASSLHCQQGAEARFLGFGFIAKQ